MTELHVREYETYEIDHMGQSINLKLVVHSFNLLNVVQKGKVALHKYMYK